MALNVKDLINAPSEDDILDGFLALLIVAGFPVTSWQPGGVARTIARLLARGLAQVATLLASITAGGFNSTATGGWLTLLAAEVYNNTIRSATFAQGQVLLSLSSAIAGPYTLIPGQLWLTWNGKRYRSTSGGTITYPATLAVAFKAESPGAKYNAPDNSLTLVTPLAGLTVAASAITTQGTDQETPDALRERNRGKWGTTGSAANESGYATWAREASQLVTRVKVQQTGGGSSQYNPIDIYVAGPAGPLSSPELAVVQAYLDARTPLNLSAVAINATPFTVALVGVVRILSSHPNSASAWSQVVDALEALFGALPIGGTLRLSDLYQTIEGIPGVDSSLLSVPVGDLVLDAAAVAVPDLTLLSPSYI